MGNKFKPVKTPPKSANNGTAKWLWPVVIGVVALVAISVVVWLVQGQGRQATVTTTPLVTGQPSASIDQAKFDYGDVKLGKTIETVFHVKNVGDKELAFQGEPRVEVIEGCWPPRAVVGSTTLKPGEETAVTLQFMMHEGMDGQHDFRVHVLTNDPKQPEQEVVIRSNWVP